MLMVEYRTRVLTCPICHWTAGLNLSGTFQYMHTSHLFLKPWLSEQAEKNKQNVKIKLKEKKHDAVCTIHNLQFWIMNALKFGTNMYILSSMCVYINIYTLIRVEATTCVGTWNISDQSFSANGKYSECSKTSN